jgi:nucleoid-associated protein YgaU
MIEVGATASVAASGTSALGGRGKSLQKAKLVVVQGDASTRELKFAYNPTEFSTSKSAKWNRPTTNSAKSATPPQFAGSEPQSVSMEVFFDAWEDQGDVYASVKTLFDWTKPTTSSVNKKLPNPPILAFQWGANKVLADFRGYLKSVSAKYTLFRPDGVPLRATASISLEEVPQEPAGTNPTSGSLNSRRSHVMADGDSLHSVAYREYGDPGLWRALASFNGLDDPMRVGAGTRILIPSPSEAADLSAIGADGD